MNTKTCSRCNTNKPLSSFHKDYSTRDGYHTMCGECRRKYFVEHYANNKERISKQRRKSDRARYAANGDIMRQKMRDRYHANKKRLQEIDKLLS